MNPRIATGAVGAIMVLLGILGLLMPEFVMSTVLGFEVHPSHAENAVRGEVRAVYGGIFLAAGAWTLWAATSPAANRTLIFFVASLWLAACAGRVFGVFVDGNPGLFGWLSVVFELVCGGALLFASQLASDASPAAAPPFGT